MDSNLYFMTINFYDRCSNLFLISMRARMNDQIKFGLREMLVCVCVGEQIKYIYMILIFHRNTP